MKAQLRNNPYADNLGAVQYHQLCCGAPSGASVLDTENCAPPPPTERVLSGR